MPMFIVPATLQVTGVMVVEAESAAEALKKASDQDYVEIDINTPVDIIDAESDESDEDEVEKLPDDG